MKNLVKLVYTFTLWIILVGNPKTAYSLQIKNDSIDYYQTQALILQKSGKYLLANDYLQKIINISKKKKNTAKYQIAYKSYLVNLIQAQAFDLFQQKSILLLEELKRSPQLNNDFSAFLYSLISYTYNVQGNYQKAIKFQRKIITIWQAKNNSKNLARAYLGLSIYYGDSGAHEKSLTYAHKSLSIFKNLHDSINIANSLHNISMTQVAQKSYKKALKYAIESFELRKLIHPANHQNIDNSHQVIGLIYTNLGNQEKALHYFTRSLNYRIKKYNTNHPLVASSYVNIANAYRKQNKNDSTLKYYRKAIQVKKDLNQIKDLMFLNNSIAKLYQNTINYKEALSNYQKALYYNSKKAIDTTNFNQNPKKYINARFFLQSLKGKASVLQSMGDAKSLKIALETYQLCDEVIQKLRQQYVNYQDKLTLANLSAEIYEQAVIACHQMIQKQPAQEARYTQLAFQFSERNKASILRETLQEANAKFDLPENLLEQERDLKINLAYYEKQLANAQTAKKNKKDSAKIVRFQNKLFDLNREREQMTQMLEKRYPKYYQVKYNTQLANLATIKKHLPNKALLIEYFTTAQKSFAFVVSETQCKMIALKGGKNTRKIIRKYRRSLKTRKPVSYFAPASYAAYQALVKPLEAYLQGKEQLIVVADDVLLGIPFEALISQKAPEMTSSFDKLSFLVKQFRFSYHYSANLMVQPMLKGKKTQKSAFLGFAPVFTQSAEGKTRDDSIDQRPKSLPYTEKEIDKIMEVFKLNGLVSTRAVLHKKATEAAFKQAGKNFRFVHLATHSITNAKRPELAYIQFEPTPKQKENFNEGRLYANEIYALNLNADLVVLSSCESGSGKIERGEGMMGLNRGFLYAGARNVIYSLWKVNDRPTSEFMISFYKNLIQQKYSFHKALQQTKLQYLKKHPRKRPHDWAGFLIIGQL